MGWTLNPNLRAGPAKVLLFVNIIIIARTLLAIPWPPFFDPTLGDPRSETDSLGLYWLDEVPTKDVPDRHRDRTHPKVAMFRARMDAEQGAPIASDPLVPSALKLDRRNSKLKTLQILRQRCNQAAGPCTIDYEVEQIRDTIRTKALDEEFSVALRERWQTWSRTANPFRSELASSAASELKSVDPSASDSEGGSEDLAGDDSSDQVSHDSPNKKKRKRTAAGKHRDEQGVTSEANPSDNCESIRRDREASLATFDAALPRAFRYSDRQVKVYAHRLKTKYINSLDRPFEAKDVHRLLHPSRATQAETKAHGPQAGLCAAAQATGASLQPTVFTISFFSGSIDWSEEYAAARNQKDLADGADGDNARDDYVKRICGDGLGGMRRTQTVELLSTQSLSTLHSSLVCWSNEQPERVGWRERLSRQAEQHSGVQHGTIDHDAENEDQDVHSARYTGRPRQTDTALVIEDKLYSKGARHGDKAYEADYATLLQKWIESTGNTHIKAGWSSKGGDLDQRLDQIGAIRVGQPYWLLHQGDCVHCFVVEQVRALRPSEEAAMRRGTPASNIETAPLGAAFMPLPRITWLSTPAMLRFAADSKHSYGVGHHILQWEGSLPFPDSASAEAGSRAAGNTVSNPWQSAKLRIRRSDEAMLRQKQGKCLSCSLRKAQVGILGGVSVRLPLASNDPEQADSPQAEPTMDGLDDHLTSICTPCAALLGLPTRPIASTQTGPELDWDRIDKEKHRRAGWTVFPLY